MYFNQVEFGQRIRELRKIQGKTQEELAAEMNVSYDHLKKIEMGLRACSLDLLVEFSTYFDVSADYLLTGKDYESIRAKVRLEAVRLLQASCRSGLSTVLAFTADVAPHHRFVPDECVFGCQGALLSLLL